MTPLFFQKNPLYLSYCTNIQPAEDLQTALHHFSTYTVPLRQQVFPTQALGLGLWISRRFATELLDHRHLLEQLQRFSQEHQLFHFTLNGFPYGSFHGERVKENVFLPSWLQNERVEYLQDLARILTKLLPDSLSKGSISTLSGTFKLQADGKDIWAKILENQLKLVLFLYQLEQETGKQIAVALEPEPLNTLETTEEILQYFQDYVYRLGAPKIQKATGKNGEEILRRYLGICYDTCHQACQFENISESLFALKKAGVVLHKVQLSNALHLENPARNPEGITQLKRFQENVYLHQIIGKKGTQRRIVKDLEDFFENVYPQAKSDWSTMDAWRIHFHVPLFHPGTPNLQTTQQDLEEALQIILQEEMASHFEIETYTWDVIPKAERELLRASPVEGLKKEFCYILDLFEKHGVSRGEPQVCAPTIMPENPEK